MSGALLVFVLLQTVAALSSADIEEIEGDTYADASPAEDAKALHASDEQQQQVTSAERQHPLDAGRAVVSGELKNNNNGVVQSHEEKEENANKITGGETLPVAVDKPKPTDSNNEARIDSPNGINKDEEASPQPTVKDVEAKVNDAEMIVRILEMLAVHDDGDDSSPLLFMPNSAGVKEFSLDRTRIAQKDKEAADQLLTFMARDKQWLSENGPNSASGQPSEALILREGVLSFKFALHDAESLLIEMKKSELDRRDEFATLRERINKLLAAIPHAYEKLDQIVFKLAS